MILNIILGILVCVGLIYLMEKYIPLKFNPTISIFLWVVILFLGIQSIQIYYRTCRI